MSGRWSHSGCGQGGLALSAPPPPPPARPHPAVQHGPAHLMQFVPLSHELPPGVHLRSRDLLASVTQFTVLLGSAHPEDCRASRRATPTLGPDRAALGLAWGIHVFRLPTREAQILLRKPTAAAAKIPEQQSTVDKKNHRMEQSSSGTSEGADSSQQMSWGLFRG